jgi:NADPH-dependent 2,4-dienoyl-CoA reductase/sulfur reductase-like enzyme
MIVIIGAGPAGLAAARVFARHNIAATILDAAPRVGGQYWRHREHVSGYRSERSLNFLTTLQSSTCITHVPSATVWSIEKQDGYFDINYLCDGRTRSIQAEKIILATGAYDRALPFSGWDLPGSMTPGAAQAALKGQDYLVGKRIAIAGTGPFLLPVATGLSEAGAEVVGVFEANNPSRWLLSLHAIALNPGKILELLHYQRRLRVENVSVDFGKSVVSFDGSFVGITDGTRVAADVVAVGWGFQPDVTLGGILECKQTVMTDGTVALSVDRNQRSSQQNIWIAGEATGIGGADLSLIEGEIAALSALDVRVPFSSRFTRLRKRIFARALTRSYPVRDEWIKRLEDSTTICRCEEVTLQEIKDSVTELGAENSRTAKLFTRAGMGLCQGRMCSRSVSDLVAEIRGCPISDTERIGASNRPIAAPISLGELGNSKSFD